MSRCLALGSLAIALLAPAAIVSVPASIAHAQQDVMVLVVDDGGTSMNQRRLIAALSRATHRDIIRMTDERAPMARGRLSIAYQRPNRWVLRYEADGQVAWVSDRVDRPGELRERLVALAVSCVTVIDGPPQEQPAPAAERPARRRTRGSWDDDIILALRDELVDPFADDHPRTSRRAPLLWSEVVDPFATPGSRSRQRQVWSEVLDPWAREVPRR